MRHFVTDDGEQYDAKNALELVQQLKDTSRTGAELTLNEFMRAAAKRASEASGLPVRSRCAEQFVHDLLETSLLKERH